MKGCFSIASPTFKLRQHGTILIYLSSRFIYSDFRTNAAKEIQRNSQKLKFLFLITVLHLNNKVTHAQSFINHASLKEIYPVHVFSGRVQRAQIITIITTRTRCCFSLSSNKQLRHTPQDSRSQTTQDMSHVRAYHSHDAHHTIHHLPHDLIQRHNYHYLDRISSTSFTFNHFTKQSLCCKIKITTILDIFKKTFHIYVFSRSVWEYLRASRYIPNSFIYLSFDIFDTFRKNVRDVA